MEKLKGYEENYEIHSDMGNGQPGVYSLRTKDYIHQLKRLKNKPDYHIINVNLWKNNKSRRKELHRLVAEHFIPNPDNLKEVDHINRNPCDNRLENLRWFSRSFQNVNTNSKNYYWNTEKIKWVIAVYRNGKTTKKYIRADTPVAELKRLALELKKEIFPDYPWETWVVVE